MDPSLVPYYKMALINARTYLHWTLKYIRDFYAYPPLAVLSVSITEQGERVLPAIYVLHLAKVVLRIVLVHIA